MSGSQVADVVSGVFLVLGALLSLSGAIGLVRLPDLLTRMHAATKPQVLGLALAAVGLAVQEPSFGTITTLVLVAVFQGITAPVAAHMVGRAGYRTKHVADCDLTRDELADAVRRAKPDPD